MNVLNAAGHAQVVKMLRFYVMYILPQNIISQKKKKQKEKSLPQNSNRDFACGSAVKTALQCQCRGVGLIPSGNWRSHMHSMVWPRKRKTDKVVISHQTDKK